ncbi:DUF4870 domain-containing protein [Candidatus Formimonas warabiya]|uniref:DUF4870 domain-containing protein n=1 Tax=Formimonas warabiya TaxID=1761012 RepID=UPI001BE4AD2A|nr:DUF4870 domain-containing protein [Candidatus Formimonas warabiya]
METKERALVSIAHLCILINFPGLFIAFVIYFLEKDNSCFVKKGVKQAVGLQLIVCAFLFIFKTVRFFGLFSISFGRTSSLLALGLSVIYGAIALMAIYAAFMSYKGNDYRYPLIGKFIDNYGRE